MIARAFTSRGRRVLVITLTGVDMARLETDTGALLLEFDDIEILLARGSTREHAQHALERTGMPVDELGPAIAFSLDGTQVGDFSRVREAQRL